MKRSNKALLLDIRQAIEYIREDTIGYNLEMFKANRTVRDAVYRNFSIIGEAIKRIEDQVKDKEPHTPWKKIAGFRDVLIHDYFGVDIELVWSVIDQNLNELEDSIDKLLQTQQL